MSLYFNGTEVKNVYFNGTLVDNGFFNNVIAFKRGYEIQASSDAYANIANYEVGLLNAGTASEVECQRVVVSGVQLWKAVQSGVTYYLGKHLNTWFTSSNYAINATGYSNSCYVKSDGRRVSDNKAWTKYHYTTTTANVDAGCCSYYIYYYKDYRYAWR